MSTMPMSTMPDDGDPGDEQQGYQQCQQDIEDLEARVSAIEKKLGMASPQDEEDPLKAAIAGTKGAFGS